MFIRIEKRRAGWGVEGGGGEEAVGGWRRDKKKNVMKNPGEEINNPRRSACH